MGHHEIARKLLEAYEQAGVSYADLSKATGIHKSMIQRYLSGTVKIPTERLELLCRALDLDAQELLGWGDRTPRTADEGMVTRSMTPQQAVLFDASRDLTDEERLAVINMINAFKAGRGE